MRNFTFPGMGAIGAAIAAVILLVTGLFLAASTADPITGAIVLRQILGFWMVMGTLLVGAVLLLGILARRLVGPVFPEQRGDREMSVVVTLVVALIVAPGAASDLGRGATGLLRALFLQSPYLASEGAVNSNIARVQPIPAAIYSCIITADACRDAGAHAPGHAPSVAATPAPDINPAWVWFSVVFLAGLVVARGLRASRRAFFAAAADADGGGAANESGIDPPSPPRRGVVSRVLMNYPTWVAFCIYTLILAPATYLAIGALLFLHTDPDSAELVNLSAQLTSAETETLNNSQGVPVSFPAVQASLVTLDPVLQEHLPQQEVTYSRIANDLVDRGRRYDEEFNVGRQRYKSEALRLTADFRVHATPRQIQDYEALLLASYRTSIRETRARMRPCMDSMLQVQTQAATATQKGVQNIVPRPGQPDPAASQPPAATETAAAPPPPPPPPVVPPSAGPALTPAQLAERSAAFLELKARIERAQAACQADIAFPAATAPDLSAKTASATPDTHGAAAAAPPQPTTAFLQTLYGWLAAADAAPVLIVGLVGFGLFGAAIRMMGRIDAPSVNNADVDVARTNAQRLRSLATAARMQLEDARRPLAEATAAFDAATRALNEAQARANATAAAETAAGAALAAAQAAVNEAAVGSATLADATARKTAAETALSAAAAAHGLAESGVAQARRDHAAAQSALTAAQQPVQDADTKAKSAADQAATAEAYHQQLRSALINDRSSIVVRRTTTDGRSEHVISGAPAKVLVQGLGAAFTTFLAGQAGIHVLADDAHTNAYSLLLACFVGAVFAEEIWRSARRYLPGSTPAVTPPAPTPPAPPSPPIA